MISLPLFLRAVQGVLSIIIMFMIGYVISRLGWIDEKISKAFSRIILNVALPCYMIYNIMSNYSRNQFESLAFNLIIPFLSIAITYILGIIFSIIFKVKNSRRGVFRTAFFTSNCIFIGLPINLALFGTKGVPYLLLYYIANTTSFWTIGTYEISKDGNHETKHTFFTKGTVKRVLSPALMGFSFALVLVFLQIQLPDFIIKSCEYVGNLTTPLAMLFIGYVLFSVKIRKIKIEFETILIIIGRFIISPLIVIGLAHIFKTPTLIMKVFVIQSAMPTMTTTSIVSKEYGADYEFATVAVVLTTVLSMAVIPIYMMLL